MQGSIVQSIGLVLAVNARRRGLDPGPFWPSASMFQFCRSVTFADDFWAGGDPALVAGDPGRWLDVVSRSARGAWLHVTQRNDLHISDRESVGLVGGGPRWIIEIVGDRSSNFFEDSWQVVDPDAADDHIWAVEYRRILSGPPRAPAPQRSVPRVADDLRASLARAMEFAGAHLPGFAPAFQNALRSLEASGPSLGVYHDDLVPPGLLRPDARRLLGAAQRAWVFGAMGSWNDVAFERPLLAEHEEISDRLFSLVVEAAVVATNTSFSGLPD